MDLDTVREWNWGTGCLVFMYQNLNETSNWRTRLLTIIFVPTIKFHFNFLLITIIYSKKIAYILHRALLATDVKIINVLAEDFDSVIWNSKKS